MNVRPKNLASLASVASVASVASRASRVVARARTEARGAPMALEGERALASLAVRTEPASELVRAWTGASEVGVVGAPPGEPLDRAARRAVTVLAPDVYASVPGRAARVALLRLAAVASTEHVVVHVKVLDEHSHAGRLVLDAPRRALRALGVPAAEPGDRFGPDAYAHCFFDEEPLLGEVRDAALEVVGRSGASFLLAPRSPAQAARASERAAPFARELAAAFSLAAEAERARRGSSPERALATMRALGRRARTRGPVGRARLRRAISWVDAAMGASCYRRVLLELALDGGAAREPVVFGLDVGKVGHAAFKGREDRTFDVVFELGPDDGRA